MKRHTYPKVILLSILSGGLTAIILSALIFVNFERFIAKDESAPVIQDQDSSPSISNIIGNDLTSQEEKVISAVKKTTPAVVSIIISKDVPIVEQYYEEPFSDPFLEDFFGGNPFQFQVPQYREKGTEKREIGGGSGFLVSEDGFVITNKHVVNESDADYTVFLQDGSKYLAKVIDKDPLNDLAVLKIDIKNSAYLTFGDSDNLQVGQSVIAIGNPLLEFNNSVSVGVVSGLSRSIVAGDSSGYSEQLDGVIQTDAAINLGNSGGPLLNLNGEVIGVNVATASAENIGFALPGNLAKNVYASVKSEGRIIRAFLGVRYRPITEQLKKVNKLPVDYGVIILRGEKSEDLAVIPGSPADKAGLQENDIILEADDQKISEKVSLARLIARKKVGDSLNLKVMRKGKIENFKIILEELPR